MCHLIYKHDENNIAVLVVLSNTAKMCKIKKKTPKLAPFEVAKVSHAVLIVGNKLLCDISYRRTVWSLLVAIQQWVAEPFFAMSSDDNEHSPACSAGNRIYGTQLVNRFCGLPKLASFLVVETLTQPTGCCQNVISPLT